jgi:tol-pal system protein YbgF
MRSLLMLASGVALLASGCFYPADRGRALEAKLTALSNDNAQLAASLKDTQEKLAATQPKIDAKVAQVTQALESLDRAARRSDADIGVQLQKVIEDMAELRGMVETYQHRIDELDAGLKKLSEDTDKRLTELQGQEAVRAAEAKKKAEALQKPTEPKPFLALADEKLKAKDLPLARGLYGEFLKKWPKEPQVAAAHFGLGETYFQEEKWREALFEYGKVMQEYPKSTVAPDAYLRASESFRKLNMGSESRLALEELVKSYPKSEAAKEAKTKLAELDKAKKGAAKPPPAKPPAKPPPAPAKPAAKKGK